MRNKADPLLILRGLACLAVFFWHIGPPKYYLVIKGINFSWITFPSGLAAVWIFFILSGYLMGKIFFIGRYTLTKAGILRFYISRFLRIAPAYYLNILFLAIFIYPAFLRGRLPVFINLLTFRQTDFYPIANFNSPIWTVSTEMQFFLLVPIFFVLFSFIEKKFPLSILAGEAILILGFAIRAYITVHGVVWNAESYSVLVYTPLIANLDIFLFGFFLNMIVRRAKKNTSAKFWNRLHRNLLGTAVTVLSLLFLYFFANYNTIFVYSRFSSYREAVTYTLPFLACLVTGWYIVYFETVEKFSAYKNRIRLNVKSVMENPVRLLEIVGILSFEIYIWHKAVIDIFGFTNYNVTSWVAFLQKAIPAFLITVLVSVVTYLIVEKPVSKVREYVINRSAR